MRMRNEKDPISQSNHSDVADFDCSHYVRLWGRQWLVVAVTLLALVGLGPSVWERIERFGPDDDYRVPYELSNDYWLYHRHSHRACEQEKVLLVGDSVVWGHYVEPDQTLSHWLNELSGGGKFVNLGADGTHPAALEGLLRHYGADISGRTVVLHLNPLWMSSSKHDLQTTKEFHFNHPELVPQLIVKIPCYKAPWSTRVGIAVRRKLLFFNWTSHMRAAYFQNMSLAAWSIEHPYACPLAAMARELPEPAAPERPSQASQSRREPRRQEMAWVDLDSSLQWRFFRRTVQLLRQRGNTVFVLVGPFNEHMLTDENRVVYDHLKHGIETWMLVNRVPHLVAPPLPPERYVDASHPDAEGYALLARMLMEFDMTIGGRHEASSFIRD
jgi:hypothetical protein